MESKNNGVILAIGLLIVGVIGMAFTSGMFSKKNNGKSIKQ